MENLNYSLLANYLAIVVLFLKSLFDLWINRYIFDRQIRAKTDKLDALEKRNARGNITSAVAFAATALSIIMAIGGTMSDESKNATKEQIDKLQQSMNEHHTRLNKIENTIWPPDEGSDYGTKVPNGPWDPVGMQNSLDEIKNELADLTAKGNITDKRLDRLITIVNELTEHVDNYSKSVKQLEKFMAAPAR